MFKCVTGQMGNMRKPVEWVLCPQDANDRDRVCIQCDKRIARVNLVSGLAILSDGKGGHPGFHKLHPSCGSTVVNVPAEMLAKLRALCATNTPGNGIGSVTLAL